MENDETANLTNVFAPVEIMLPSLQHKHPVLVYDSKRFPGKSSEWFFHKLNRVSGFYVYRCVRCKSVNEKSKRSGAGSIGVPARIYIQNDHFMNDPDFPYGEHICQFETNPECDTSSVYAKRAILEANKDMRLNPERPMAKYVKMLTLFEQDSGRYGHLDPETKKKAQTILNQVGNGFNARKRGLMLNYQLGKKQKKKEGFQEMEVPVVESVKTEVVQEDIVDIEAVETKSPPNLKQSTPQPTIKPDYPCGGPDCTRIFKSAASRTRHRSKIHGDLYFIDTDEDLYVFRKTLEAQELHNHPILSDQTTPLLPFAVKWQQQVDTEYAGYTGDETAAAVFQTNVTELLNTIHSISCYLPTDPNIHNEFIDDLQNIIQKYIPIQQQTPTVTIEEEQIVEENPEE